MRSSLVPALYDCCVRLQVQSSVYGDPSSTGYRSESEQQYWAALELLAESLNDTW
jgi:hypothetical protein